MNTLYKTASWISSVFGITGLMLGPTLQPAARADDGWRYDHRDRIELDRKILREDEDHLSHLERRLDEQTLNHEKHEARDTRREIDRTRADIDRDRRNLDRDYGRHDGYRSHE